MKYIPLVIAYIFSIAPVSPARAEVTTHADSLLEARKYFSFAVQYKNAESYAEAASQYEHSLAYNDTVYQVHFSYADLLMKLDRPLDARRHYLCSFMLNPGHVKSAQMLARLYYESAVYDSTLVMYEALYDLEGDPAMLRGIAALRNHLGRLPEALDAYGKLSGLGAAGYEDLLAAAETARDISRNDKAVTFAETALEKRPSDEKALRIAAGSALAADDIDTAESHFAALAGIAPEDTAVIDTLVRIAEIRGDTTERISWLERRLALTPENGAVISGLAELYFDTGRDDDGIRLTEKGLTVMPVDGRLNMLAGEYYRSQGDIDRAAKHYRTAAKDAEWEASALQRIGELEPRESADEKAEREFFSRGRKDPE